MSIANTTAYSSTKGTAFRFFLGVLFDLNLISNKAWNDVYQKMYRWQP